MTWVNIIIAIITVVYISFAQILELVPGIIIFFLLLDAFIAFMDSTAESTVSILVPEKDLMKANSINLLYDFK